MPIFNPPNPTAALIPTHLIRGQYYLVNAYPTNAVNNSSDCLVANTIFFYPITIPFSTSSVDDKIAINFTSGVSGKNTLLGIYTNRLDQATREFAPRTRIKNGSIDTASSGIKTINIHPLNAGTYWLAILSNSSGGQIRGASSSALFTGFGAPNATSNPYYGYELSLDYSTGLPTQVNRADLSYSTARNPIIYFTSEP
jgi:hypothetical protein